jgi:hypothetical protein
MSEKIVKDTITKQLLPWKQVFDNSQKNVITTLQQQSDITHFLNTIDAQTFLKNKKKLKKKAKQLLEKYQWINTLNNSERNWLSDIASLFPEFIEAKSFFLQRGNNQFWDRYMPLSQWIEEWWELHSNDMVISQLLWVQLYENYTLPDGIDENSIVSIIDKWNVSEIWLLAESIVWLNWFLFQDINQILSSNNTISIKDLKILLYWIVFKKHPSNIFYCIKTFYPISRVFERNWRADQYETLFNVQWYLESKSPLLIWRWIGTVLWIDWRDKLLGQMSVDGFYKWPKPVFAYDADGLLILKNQSDIEKFYGNETNIARQ